MEKKIKGVIGTINNDKEEIITKRKTTYQNLIYEAKKYVKEHKKSVYIEVNGMNKLWIPYKKK